MKKTIDEQDFIQEFHNYNRGDYFSRDALSLIFNYIEECYGEDSELDVIGVCGDYNEVSLLQFVEDYDLDIEDFIDEEDCSDTQNEFNYDYYLKLVSEVLTNYCPENYVNYRILSEKLVKRDEEDGYYRVLLIAIHEDDSWVANSEVYFVTDIDYKFNSVAQTNCEAIEIGNNLSQEDYNLVLKDELEKKELSWEDIDDDKLEEIISEYINDRGYLVGFTNQGTVVFQDF